MTLVFDFQSWRDPKGYRLEENTGRILRMGRGRNKKDFDLYNPLEKVPDLYLIFARQCTKHDGVVDFVNRFGPLTVSGLDPYHCDVVKLVVENAASMHRVLKFIADDRKLPDLGPKPLQFKRSIPFRGILVWDPALKTLKWKISPDTLLDGIWFQLEQALTRRARIRVCGHCGTWFEAGRGTDRRADAKFCSDEHKIAFHSLNRSREK